jgi:hypothetical protein
MSDFLALQRVIAGSERLRRAAQDVPVEGAAPGAGLDPDLCHLAGQVARQARLPRDPDLDHRFLTHLEWALRDLATRPFEPRPLPPSMTGAEP